MAEPTEAERAAAFRVAAQGREDAALARERALTGNAALRLALDLAFGPLRRWPGWDPIERVDEDRLR